MEYPSIEIVDTTYSRERKPARKINEKLCVAFANVKWDRSLKIYSISAGRHAIPHRIKTFEDAVAIAKLLIRVYGEYWDILDHPDWDKAYIPQMAMYSVPDGEKVFEALTRLESCDVITFDMLNKEMETQ